MRTLSLLIVILIFLLRLSYALDNEDTKEEAPEIAILGASSDL